MNAGAPKGGFVMCKLFVNENSRKPLAPRLGAF
jgi:hypothetical protein